MAEKEVAAVILPTTHYLLKLKVIKNQQKKKFLIFKYFTKKIILKTKNF